MRTLLTRRRYIGKANILRALDGFYRSYPNVALQVNVTRHPYSFIGDSKASDGAKSGGLQGVDKDGKESEPTETWHDGLLGYMGGSHTARDSAEKQMAQLGLQAGISFDYNVLTQWQPVKSQRLLLWAGRYVDTKCTRVRACVPVSYILKTR